MDVQKGIVKELNEDKIGYVYSSIVEGKVAEPKNTYLVRPYFNARDIDDKVLVKTKEELISGSFVNVEIKKVNAYDLEGELV